MTIKCKIADLAPGATFDAGLLNLRIMEHRTDGTTLVVANKPIGDRTFNTAPFSYKITDDFKPNNFATSTLMKDLNGDFLTDLLSGAATKKFGISADDVVPALWNLEDHEGGEGYGCVICKVAILTQKEYQKYIDAGLLPEECWEGWEWTRTPYAGDAYYARLVYTGGSLDNDSAWSGSNGVRPALILKSGTLVSIEEDMADLSDHVLLADFSSRQLAQEIFRRIAEDEDAEGDE